MSDKLFSKKGGNHEDWKNSRISIKKICSKKS